jgi:CheY-like chemotaxis protein/class 3 adenylate cyclase
MSPEQIRCSEVDHRSDLWSLGVLLYRAITGVLPFDAYSVGALMVGICMDPFPPPSSLVPSLPAGVDAFFAKALAKAPEKRFQTAAELSAAFRALASPTERRAAKILVVDDEPQVARLFAMQFRKQVREGVYHFVFASNGEEALQALREHPDLDVVFTDINMPTMDGLTFLSHLGEANPFARAVVVSAYGDMQNIRTAMNHGAFDFLTKPIDFGDLEVTAQKTLRLTAELRKSARHSEVYGELRKFVSPSLLRRVEGQNGGIIECTEGTVAFIGISPPDAPASEPSAADHLRSLNVNFEIIVPLVERHDGVIHKFIGGAAMVVFKEKDHIVHALDACLDIRDHLQGMALRAGASSPFAMGVSIGVASGSLIIGEVGSNAYDRLDLAVLGEAQVTGMRLQLAAKKNQVLVGSTLSDALLGMFELSPLDEGTSPEGITAFEIVDRARRRPDRRAMAEAETVDLLVKDGGLASSMGDSGVRSQGAEEISLPAVGSSG